MGECDLTLIIVWSNCRPPKLPATEKSRTWSLLLPETAGSFLSYYCNMGLRFNTLIISTYITNKCEVTYSYITNKFEITHLTSRAERVT